MLRYNVESGEARRSAAGSGAGDAPSGSRGFDASADFPDSVSARQGRERGAVEVARRSLQFGCLGCG